MVISVPRFPSHDNEVRVNMLSISANLRQALGHPYYDSVQSKRGGGRSCKLLVRDCSRPKTLAAVIRSSLNWRILPEQECPDSSRELVKQVLGQEGWFSRNEVSCLSRLSSLWQGYPCLSESTSVDACVNAGISVRKEFPC